MRRPAQAKRNVSGGISRRVLIDAAALRNLPGAPQGAGGGKGGGGGFTEDPDTLQSRAMARVLDIISEGEIKGVVGGAKGIYLDKTPVQNDDDSENFKGIGWWTVNGTADQPYIPGFPAAEAEVGVATELTASGGRVTRRINQLTTNAVRVTAGLPNGLSETNTKDGHMKGSSVVLRVEVKPQADSGGSWIQVRDWTISGKATSAYEEEFRFDLPGEGPWDIGLTRLTADASSSSVVNTTSWVRYTRIIDHKFSYPHSALIGLEINAEYFGQSIPPRRYLVDGILCRVPTNYDPEARTYATTGEGTTGGAWDGTFKRAWTNNPVWVFFDQLTEPRYGLGAPDSRVDKFALYSIAQYCDESVPDGFGGTEPRLTFNGVIRDSAPASQVLQSIASCFRGMFYWSAGLYTAVQDGPRDPVAQFSQANVVGGDFNYTATPKKARHTVAIVEWENPSLGYEQDFLVVEDAEAIARYGYNPIEIKAFGCTSRGQAWRFGKWALVTEKFERQSVTFRTGLEGKHLLPGDIINISDPYYAGARMAGRLISVAGDRASVVLDKPFAFDAGTDYLVSIQLKDGTLFESEITNPGTTATTANLVTLLPSDNLPVEGATYALIADDLAPMRFRVVHRKEVDKGTFEIFAVERFEGKFDLVDINPSFDTETTPVTRLPNPSYTSPPGDVTAVFETRAGANALTPRILVSWGKSPDTHIAGYVVYYRAGNGNWQSLPMTTATEAVIENVTGEDYSIRVVALNVFAIPSQAKHATVEAADITVATGKDLISDIRVQGGGTSFAGPNAVIAWNSTAISSPDADGVTSGLDPAFESFRVKVYNSAESVTYRTEEVTTPRWDYTADKIKADGVGRSFKIGVALKAKDGTYSNEVKTAFSNPAPLAPTFSLVSGPGNVEIRAVQPTDADFVGFLIHASTTSGFTPDVTNLVHDGPGAFTLSGTPGQTIYVRVGAYDTFGQGGIIYASQQSAAFGSITANTVLAGSIVAASFASGVAPVEYGASLPGAGNYAGRQYFLTTDNKLYRHTGSAWVATIATTDLTGTIGTAQIAANAIDRTKFATGLTPIEYGASLPASDNFAGRQYFLTSDNKLYRHNGTSWLASVAAGDITGTLTNSQIADLAAAKITGQITTTQITDDAVTAAKIAAGQVTTEKLAASAVTADKIDALAVTTAKLAAGAITAEKIATSAITADKIDAGAVTAAKIAAATITGDKIAANTITVSRLVVTDTSNMVSDGGFSDVFGSGRAWLTSTNYPVRVTGDALNTTLNSPVIAKWTGPGTAEPSTRWDILQTANREVPVEPSKPYFFHSEWAVTSGFNGRAYFDVQWLDAANAHISYAAIQTGTSYWSSAAGGTVTFTLSGVVTAPSNAAKANVRCYIDWNTDYATRNKSGTAAVARPVMRRAANSEIIVDGAIITDKLAANAVTAAKILAGAIETDKLAANAVTTAKLAANSVTAGIIAAGAVTASKMFIGTPGASLSDDPGFSDSTAWPQAGGTAGVFGTVTDGVAGNTVLRNTSAGVFSWHNGLKHVPVDAAKTYRLRGYARNVSGSGCRFYLGIDTYNASGTFVQRTYTAANNVVPPGTWTEYVGTITGAAILALGSNIKTMKPTVLVGYPDGGGTYTAVHECQDVRLEEVLPGTLIQDGAIITAKLAANAVTADKILAGSINATHIAANSIVASKLLVQDFSNLCEDPYGTNSGVWSVTSNATLNVTTAAIPAGKAIQITAASGYAHNNVARIPARTGETYRISYTAWLTAGSGTARFWLRHLNSAGSSISGDLYNGTQTLSTTPTRFTTTVTLNQANTAFMQYYVQAATLSGGNMMVSDVYISRMNSAELIVDGSINATHLAASSITADKLNVTSLSAITANLGDITAGNLSLTASGYVVYHGAGFGASSDLIMWFGASSTSRAAATKTNGIFALATDGKVYFGTADLATQTGGAASVFTKTQTTTNFATSGTTPLTVATIDANDVPAGGYLKILGATLAVGTYTLNSGTSWSGTLTVTEQLQSGGTEHTIFSGTVLVDDTGGFFDVTYNGGLPSTDVFPTLPIAQNLSGNVRYRMKIARNSGSNNITSAPTGFSSAGALIIERTPG